MRTNRWGKDQVENRCLIYLVYDSCILRTHLPPRGTRSMCDTDNWLLLLFFIFSHLCFRRPSILCSIIGNYSIIKNTVLMGFFRHLSSRANEVSRGNCVTRWLIKRVKICKNDKDWVYYKTFDHTTFLSLSQLLKTTSWSIFPPTSTSTLCLSQSLAAILSAYLIIFLLLLPTWMHQTFI